MQTVIRLIILFLLHSLAAETCAQFAFYNEHYTEGKFTYELFADAGGMNCLTDLGGNKGAGKPFVKDLNIGQSKITYGISASVNYKRLISFRVQFVKGMVGADDKLLQHAGPAAGGRYLRNLDFHSQIRELSALVEFFPIMFLAKEGSWLPPADWYIFAGIGYFHFNPKTSYGEKEVELWPLRTEGQGFKEVPGILPYRRDQLNVPFGTGVKIGILPIINLRLEIHCRKLFTDYLDDVSSGYVDPALFVKYLPPSNTSIAIAVADRRTNPAQRSVLANEIRGNSKNKDSFFSAVMRISLVLGRESGH